MKRQHRRTVVITSDYQLAITNAKKYAAEGPRVASIIVGEDKQFAAVPGFMDHDLENVKQVALITPDGRVWVVI